MPTETLASKTLKAIIADKLDRKHYLLLKKLVIMGAAITFKASSSEEAV